MKGKNVKKVLSAVLAGTMLLSLAACGNGNEGNAGSSGEKTKSEDQVLSIALGEEPTILDPYQIQDDNAFNVSYAVTEPLFRIAGEDGKDWEPGLATEFEENEDATVYTVTLRENGLMVPRLRPKMWSIVFREWWIQVLRRQRRMTTSI